MEVILMTVAEEEEVAEKVGNYEFVVRFADETPESRRRWEQRSEALAAWLLALWQQQNAENN
jgi:hypothetical protein